MRFINKLQTTVLSANLSSLFFNVFSLLGLMELAIMQKSNTYDQVIVTVDVSNAMNGSRTVV